jgi:hypothetical protein
MTTRRIVNLDSLPNECGDHFRRSPRAPASVCQRTCTRARRSRPALARSPAIEMDINALNAGGVPRPGLKSCLMHARRPRLQRKHPRECHECRPRPCARCISQELKSTPATRVPLPAASSTLRAGSFIYFFPSAAALIADSRRRESDNSILRSLATVATLRHSLCAVYTLVIL